MTQALLDPVASSCTSASGTGRVQSVQHGVVDRWRARGNRASCLERIRHVCALLHNENIADAFLLLYFATVLLKEVQRVALRRQKRCVNLWHGRHLKIILSGETVRQMLTLAYGLLGHIVVLQVDGRRKLLFKVCTMSTRFLRLAFAGV